MVQSAVADPTGRKGQVIQGPWPQDIRAYNAEGALAAGNLLKLGTDAETQVLEIPTLPVADVDAVITGAVLVSAAAAATIHATSFDGAIGRDRIVPARTVTITFDADAHWDTGGSDLLVDIYGIDAAGGEIKDTIAKATGSGAGIISTGLAFAMVYRVDVGAGSGAAGTATMGVSNDKVELSSQDYPGLCVYEPVKEPATAAREFADEESVEILAHGRMISIPEHAVSVGDDVYVRVVAAGADLCGQLTGQDGADTPATYAKLAGARWATAALADVAAKVEL